MYPNKWPPRVSSGSLFRTRRIENRIWWCKQFDCAVCNTKWDKQNSYVDTRQETPSGHVLYAWMDHIDGGRFPSYHLTGNTCGRSGWSLSVCITVPYTLFLLNIRKIMEVKLNESLDTIHCCFKCCDFRFNPNYDYMWVFSWYL